MPLLTQATGKDKFASLAGQMTKWVDQVLGPTYHNYCPAQTWRPSINLYEDDTDYALVVDLAGVKPEQIDLRVEKGSLILTGQRETPQVDNSNGPTRLHLMEIDHGRFCRQVALPSDVHVDSIQATYRNGYLWVRIPKK